MRHWFAENVTNSCLSQDALLSARRHDRTYGLGPKRILDIVVQAHAIGVSRKQALETMVNQGMVDCGTALAAALIESGEPKPLYAPLTVMELDSVLDSAAACCRFSDDSLHRRHARLGRRDAAEELTQAFQRMSPLEVKWAVRLLQKDTRLAIVPEVTVFELTHPQLSYVLRMQNSLSTALGQARSCQLSTEYGVVLPQPQAGTMVGLPSFEKALSVKHAQLLMQNRQVSVERKYDGE